MGESTRRTDEIAKKWGEWSKRNHLAGWCVVLALTSVIIPISILAILGELKVRVSRAIGFSIFEIGCLLGFLISALGIAGWLLEKWTTNHKPSWFALGLLVLALIGSLALAVFVGFANAWKQ